MSVHIWPRPIFLARAGASNALGDVTQFKNLAEFCDNNNNNKCNDNNNNNNDNNNRDQKLKKNEMVALDITMAAHLNDEVCKTAPIVYYLAILCIYIHIVCTHT
jgi:hypothetical protein